MCSTVEAGWLPGNVIEELKTGVDLSKYADEDTSFMLEPFTSFRGIAPSDINNIAFLCNGHVLPKVCAKAVSKIDKRQRKTERFLAMEYKIENGNCCKELHLWNKETDTWTITIEELTENCCGYKSVLLYRDKVKIK